jgi:hypothetical protein
MPGAVEAGSGGAGGGLEKEEDKRWGRRGGSGADAF